jgi:hypothetical protein
MLVAGFQILAHAAFSLPPNSANGVYDHTIDEGGNHNTTFLGSIEDFASAAPISRIMGRQNGATGTLNCQGDVLNQNDEVQAINSLTSQCGNGITISNQGGHRALSAVSNSVVAYICTYGGSQACSATLVAAYTGQIVQGCGLQDGFYSVPKSKFSMGVAPSSGSWC